MSAALVAGRESNLLRVLHDKHAHALWSYVVSLNGGDQIRAQDVVQETLLRAWCSHVDLERSADYGRGWLFTVARRIVIDQWRAARRRPELTTDHLPEQPVEDVAQQTVNRRFVLTALRTLSPEHKQVLFECYFHGASVAQAAERLGVPQGTIKSRTHYALIALRDALQGAPDAR